MIARCTIPCLWFLLGCVTWGKSQTDSVQIELKSKPNTTTKRPISKPIDSAKPDTLQSGYKHSPRKATLYSAFLPGLGQAYNRKYWKIPVVYAAFAGAGYAVQFNQVRFQRFKQELIKREQGLGGLDESLNLYSNSDLNELQSFYRRFRDLSVVGCLLVYTLNILDASVDAHLFEFNQNTNFQVQLAPPSLMAGPAPMLGLVYRF